MCKIDFMRNLSREKEDHNIMVKGYMLKENIILKAFVPNDITIKHNLIGYEKLIVPSYSGILNTHISVFDR